MDFGQALTGIIGGATSLWQGEESRKGAATQNAANAQEAQRNRQFQYEMSATAHQREMHDLKQAGLNPILTATGGSGAPMGSGAMAVHQNVGESSARGVASGAAAVRNLAVSATDMANAKNMNLKNKVDKEVTAFMTSKNGRKYLIPYKALRSAGLTSKEALLSLGLKKLSDLFTGPQAPPEPDNQAHSSEKYKADEQRIKYHHERSLKKMPWEQDKSKVMHFNTKTQRFE